MTEYHMTDEQLSQIVHTTTISHKDGITESQTGLTRAEWNDLSEDDQRKYYYQYGPGVNAGQPDDPQNAIPRGTEPERGEWKMEAEKGYDVNWKELRKIAQDMQYQMDGWKAKLNKVSSVSISTATLGNVKGSETFVELTNQTKTGFNEYIGAIQTAYNGVIEKLKATADQYENAENNTHGRTNSVNPSGGPQAPNLG
ncbi:hypothetical protein [Actinomadura sediminis]|uniref:WXG100 family type VII secretion target n=1 Tax=Actinomadura sediminis TaxID=1038904 RepID=A0ABW3EUY2_9ACTN